jgi:hypothetical protein
VQLHRVDDVDADQCVEGDAQLVSHCLRLSTIIEQRRNTPLDLHLWSAENLEVVAFVVHAISHQLIGREAAKTGTGHGGSGYRGDDWDP